jgi:hypothetical protein
MTIKIIGFSHGINSSSKEFIHPHRWDEVGLKPLFGSLSYRVIDERLFFLAVIKYGIEYRVVEEVEVKEE